MFNASSFFFKQTKVTYFFLVGYKWIKFRNWSESILEWKNTARPLGTELTECFEVLLVGER